MRVPSKLAVSVLVPGVLAGVLATLPGVAHAVQAPATQSASGVPANEQYARMSLSELTELVSAQVKSEYPHAVLVEADGRAPGGPTTRISDVTSWTFRFNDFDRRDVPSNINIAVPATLDGTMGAWTVLHGIWAESAPIDKPVTMSPADADHLLKAAGWYAPYETVTLRIPVSRDAGPNPLFVFGPYSAHVYPGHFYVGVDTVTGQVAPIYLTPPGR